MSEPKLETKYALNLSTMMPLSVSDVGVLRTRIRMQRRENMSKCITDEWNIRNEKRLWFNR